MTAQELRLLSDDGCRHELLKGKLLKLPFNGVEHGIVMSRLATLLANYVEFCKSGTVFMAMGCMIETGPDTVLTADIAFAQSYHFDGSDEFYSGAPDLVVEVLSIDDQLWDVDERTNRWLQAGAKAVWLVACETHTIECVSHDGKRKLFSENDKLFDSEVVVGFRVPVAEIFSY